MVHATFATAILVIFALSPADAGFANTCKRWGFNQQGNQAWFDAYCADQHNEWWHAVLNVNQ